MEIVLKRESFRNNGNDATITVEKYAEKDCAPMWRYFIKYDRYAITSGCSDGLWQKPKTKWLKSRF